MDPSSSGPSANNSSDFVRKLYKMLESPQDESVVRWGNEGDSFVVLENEKFTKHILPKHFKHSNFASFVRQLNKYDFHKVRHNNEEGGASPYGPGAWEFKHPDFKMNNKDALDNIRRKAPAPRKPNTMTEELIPTQQMDLVNTQLVATQQQLQALQERYNELSVHHSMLLQELIGVQKTVVNHEHVMQYVMNFLNNLDAQRRRESRVVPPFPQATNGAPNGTNTPTSDGRQPQPPPPEEDTPASPLQHATKLLSEVNADHMLNTRNLEQMNEAQMRMNAALTTPPPDLSLRNGGTRSSSRGAPPHSATSSTSMSYGELDNLVYPIGHTQGIDPAYSEHINNIPYPLPPKAPEGTFAPPPDAARKKSTQVDPGWIRQPQILLVEDDQTCRRIGGKFLYAFHCSIDSALDGLEAVNKMNAGAKYDLVLMDIIMPNLDGVSATHLIRQFDNTPIVAMTSNIRSDDISMYFQHGMNDVLPKPFTKEGLLSMLEKHLSHLKKQPPGIEVMPPPVALTSKRSMKSEDSPATSPATAWNSPGALAGVSPAGSHAEDPYAQAVQQNSGQSTYQVQPSMIPQQMYNTSPGGPLRAPPSQSGPPGPQHRRQISDITGGGGGNKGGEEEKTEEPFQAVVFADAFETRFNPFTLDTPRCLLPLANTPLIEYTLAFLALNGVDEVFLYCGNHTDQVEDYLSKSRWMRGTAPFRLKTIKSSAKSVGDAMRHLDMEQCIKGDFIAVYGDVIANVSIDAALAAHRSRRAKDKNAIMTMILREAGDHHRTMSHYMRPCFVIDEQSQRCVHYEQVRPREVARLDIPEAVFLESIEVDVRQDLIDCGIDICTLDVLGQWSDNFDWQALRRGFLYGVLKDYETFQRKIHTHVVKEGYAARVKNLQSYDAITKDVISRWAYPFSPETNMLEDQTYELQKGLVYKEAGVALARSSTIRQKSVVGKATSIGQNSTITNSVIGRRCVIGNRVKIDGAYIWDDARIGDDTIVESAIVGNEAAIGSKCHIQKGALISNGAKIGDGVSVKQHTRVSRLKRKRGYEEDELVRGTSDPSVVGEDGDGFVLELDEEEEEVYEALFHGVQNMDLTLDGEAPSDLDSEGEDGVEYQGHARDSRSESFASIGSAASDESGETRRQAADFYHEAMGSIFDSLQKGEDPDTIQLELTALTLASNAEGKQVRRAVAVAMSKRITNLIDGGQSPKDAVAATIPKNTRLVKGCVNIKEEDEQAEFLLLLQSDLVHRQQGDKILLFACNALATNDLMEAEGFEQWWNDPKSSETDDLKQVRAETKQLVDVLVGEEESNEEDESDEEDGEDSSEDEEDE
ncbi:heat shock transcription factor 2 [Teratosphaeria nubilosa]|uniref:Mannose-1-phosphate guanyltransferase n=1 Tax=Teratosphaeria nubilosa TaxID=161662 RepID=A0A6G1LHU9_9PEZI|nr:heat shock transcription factor 2 [Teratosphaeria nubilosa]